MNIPYHISHKIHRCCCFCAGARCYGRGDYNILFDAPHTHTHTQIRHRATPHKKHITLLNHYCLLVPKRTTIDDDPNLQSRFYPSQLVRNCLRQPLRVCVCVCAVSNVFTQNRLQPLNSIKVAPVTTKLTLPILLARLASYSRPTRQRYIHNNRCLFLMPLRAASALLSRSAVQ